MSVPNVDIPQQSACLYLLGPHGVLALPTEIVFHVAADEVACNGEVD